MPGLGDIVKMILFGGGPNQQRLPVTPPWQQQSQGGIGNVIGGLPGMGLPSGGGGGQGGGGLLSMLQDPQTLIGLAAAAKGGSAGLAAYGKTAREAEAMRRQGNVQELQAEIQRRQEAREARKAKHEEEELWPAQKARIEAETLKAKRPEYHPVGAGGGVLVGDEGITGRIPGTPKEPTAQEFERDLAFRVYASKNNLDHKELDPVQQQTAIAEHESRLAQAKRDPDAAALLNETRRLNNSVLRMQVQSGITPQQAAVAQRLSDDFARDTKEFVTVRDNYNRILASVDDPSPAGDLSLLFAYMKMLDPTSVVREGEFANAANTGSIPNRVWAQYNRILNGQRLSIPIREDFINRATKLYEKQEGTYAATNEDYTARAKKMGIPSDLVTRDLTRGVKKPGDKGGKIHVRNKSNGKTGWISPEFFDASRYEKIQ